MSDWVFPPPYLPNERYRAIVLGKPEGYTGQWPKCRVAVERLNFGTNDWDRIAEYDRGYAFLRTFHAFRQLRDGVWRDYALISRSYTRFDVMDLETGDIVAEQSPTEEQEQRAVTLQSRYLPGGKYADHDTIYAKWMRDHTPAQIAMGNGFCPVEFWVPDFVQEWDERGEKKSSTLEETLTGLKAERDKFVKYGKQPITTDKKRNPNWSWWGPEDEMLRGDWALYSGCHWGDDSSWKIQYIDLSRLSEGIVTGDDRFGYIELPRNIQLKDAVHYDGEMDRLELAMALHVNRSTGKAGKWARKYINWDGDDE